MRDRNLLMKLGKFYMALQDNLYFVYVLYTSSFKHLIADTCSETSACQASTNDIYSADGCIRFHTRKPPAINLQLV